jgi:peroxiredoxin
MRGTIHPGPSPVSAAALFPPVLALILLSVTPVWPLGSGIEVGERVPEFSLPGLDGDPVSFEMQIRGKAPLTLLFFMTTACSACYEELEALDDYVRKNPGKVDIWCVAVDLRVKYLIDRKYSLPRAFGFNYTPSLAILDAKGVVLHKKGGYSPNESIPDLIRTFLP